MANSLRLAIAGGMAGALILAAAGAALADRGGHHGQGMHGGQGSSSFLIWMRERYDANKDGKISQDEIDNNRTEWVARFDADKDGTLSLKEFEALWLEARRREMVREFQRFDRDGDAKVTVEEYKLPLADVVENRDRNGDGFLSKEDRRWRPGTGQGSGGAGGQPGNQQQQQQQ